MAANDSVHASEVYVRVCESGSMCYQFARKCDFERLSWGGEDLSRYKQCSHLGDKCACLSRKILDRFDTFRINRGIKSVPLWVVNILLLNLNKPFNYLRNFLSQS